MKKIFSLITSIVISTTLATSTFVHADKETSYNGHDDISVTTYDGMIFTADDGGFFDNATLLSEETNQINLFSKETTRTYQMSDGTICTDYLLVSQSMTRSSDSGQMNNITHKTDIGMATISIISSFDWYTSGSWSYVRCSNMTAYYSAKTTQVANKYFNKSKSNGYIKSGKAWAKVDYSFYNKYVPGSGKSGTFKVTCSDSGSIGA